MQNAGWMTYKLESILPGELSQTSEKQIIPPYWQKKEEELKRLFREGNGTPLQYSCLENRMDGGAWKVAWGHWGSGTTEVTYQQQQQRASWWGWKGKKKAGLKLNIQNTKITASSLITCRKGKSGNSDKFYLLGLQNHWGWWWLQPWN